MEAAYYKSYVERLRMEWSASSPKLRLTVLATLLESVEVNSPAAITDLVEVSQEVVGWLAGGLEDYIKQLDEFITVEDDKEEAENQLRIGYEELGDGKGTLYL